MLEKRKRGRPRKVSFDDGERVDKVATPDMKTFFSLS
jgi:AT hook motif